MKILNIGDKIGDERKKTKSEGNRVETKKIACHIFSKNFIIDFVEILCAQFVDYVS